MAKKNLSQILKSNPKVEPSSPIKMGKDFHLSTDEVEEKVSAHVHESTSASVHKSTSIKKRKAPPSKGYRIFEKHVKELKVISANESRPFWIVLNEALEEYIARKIAKSV